MKNYFFCLLLLGSVFYTAARPPSLANVGNTCYFNSIIQNLYNLEPITQALITRNKIPESKIIAEYTPLIDRFRAGQTTGFDTELERLNKTIADVGRDIELGKQGDATEAFNYMVNFTDQYGKIQAVPVFWDNMGFWSVRKYVYYGAEDDVVEIGNRESALSIIAPYPNGLKTVNQGTVVGGAFAFGTVEKVSGESAIFLEGRCPEILMVWVKVFSAEVGPTTGIVTLDRIATNFDGESFLQPLDLHDYVVADSTGFKDQDTVYNLIGVSCQSGGLGGGHYIALIKDQYDPVRPWYYCSDSAVYQIDSKQVAEQIKTIGYVFFYRKKTAEAASIARQLTERLAQSLKLLVSIAEN